MEFGVPRLVPTHKLPTLIVARWYCTTLGRSVATELVGIRHNAGGEQGSID